MKIFGREIILRRAVEESKQAPFESALMRIVAAQEGYWGGTYGAGLFGTGMGAFVNPENCMQSPTVHSIVTAVSRRISVSPARIYKMVSTKVDTDEADANAVRMRRQVLPNHPVATLLEQPNEWQTRVNYWQDAVSRLMRYGNFYAFKNRGSTGPIRALIPLHPRQIQVNQNLDTWAVEYRINGVDTATKKIHHVRGSARNGLVGDSPIQDANSSIALEIAAEQFGGSFFNNGALPLMVFRYVQGSQGFKTPEEEKQFITDFQNALGGNKRHRALLLPKGVDAGDPVKVENDKAQFLETRKYQRTVIAGCFGVPPHLVGDLERATFNNVEQQGADFTINVVLPVAQQFESAMERDLLTDQDRAAGVIIRLDLDAVQLTDFKSRQEGFKIMREAGVICPNDWRSHESMNPMPEEDGGEDFIRPLNFVVVGSDQEALLGKPPVAAPAADKPVAKPDDQAKEIMRALGDKFGELFELAEKVTQPERMMAPNIVVNIPEQQPPVVYVAPADVHVNVAPTPVDVHVDVEVPKQAPPDVHVHVPASPATETVPIRDSKTGKVVSLVNRPLKADKG